MGKIKSILLVVNKAIISKKFFYFVLAIFIFQASWIALSNNYGSPHDEKYHFELIQAYSNFTTPFIGEQPTSYDHLGDVSRNSSYLYHYMMSLPYRLIDLVTDDLTLQVISLRFINIAVVLAGLLLFKKILDEIFVKKAISNLALFGVVMTPIFTYVSEGISYDNLVFLGFALAAYLTMKLTKQFNVSTLMLWLAVNMLTILVKYSYAPIAIVLGVGLLVLMIKNHQLKISIIKNTLKETNRKAMIFSVVAITVAAGLFIERYVGNLITYGTPLPDCSKVLTVERCAKWGPWGRNVQLKEMNANKQRVGIISYAKTWVTTMESTSFGLYKTSIVKDPLPLIGLAGWIVLVLFFAFVTTMRRYVRKRASLVIFLCAIMLYIAALFTVNYRDYVAYGAPVAIQGRYLILAMPLIFGMAFAFLYETLHKRSNLLLLLTVIMVALFVQGGIVTYLVSTDQVWWWRNDAVVQINETTQGLLRLLTFKN